MQKNIYEIERKFLIKYPSAETLKLANIVSTSDIEQIYLERTEERPNARIRKRVFENKEEYTLTQKIRINDMKRIEDERIISRDDYEKLKLDADKSLKPIIKKRIVIEYKNNLFEIDIYGFWSDAAIAEIELEDEKEKFEFPPFIEIVKELTSDRRFTNHSMAKKIPDIKEYF